MKERAEYWKKFNLRKWMFKNRIRYRELIEKLETSKNTILNWANAKRVPVWAWERLQEHYGIKEDEK